MRLRGGPVLAAPYVIAAVIAFGVPAVWSLVLVFQKASLISPTRTFVGLDNVVAAIGDPKVHWALALSLLILVTFVPICVGGALLLAVLVNSLPRLKGLFAVGYFLPFVASTVAIAAILQSVLAYNSPLNSWLRQATGSSPDWFGTPVLAIGVIVLMVAWKLVGYYALIFLAGLQSIPVSIGEAAQIDGASPWQRFTRITIPMLYPSAYTVLILAVSIAFSIFIEPFILTQGGPDGVTTTWQLLVYDSVFSKLQAGYGATIALFQAIATMIAVVVIRRVVESWGRHNGF
jgi:multiple sugar transport system permease protein